MLYRTRHHKGARRPRHNSIIIITNFPYRRSRNPSRNHKERQHTNLVLGYINRARISSLIATVRPPGPQPSPNALSERRSSNCHSCRQPSHVVFFSNSNQPSGHQMLRVHSLSNPLSSAKRNQASDAIFLPPINLAMHLL